MAIRQPRPQLVSEQRSRYDGVSMSEAEYLALPEEKPYLEYVEGVVRQKPMPDHLHRHLVRFLDYLFHTYIRENGGDGGPEGRVRLGDGTGYRLPDTAFWVAGRDSSNDSVPSLVVEIRSRDQSMAELRRKCRSFRANGVDVCWLIDPYRRVVELFDSVEDGARVAADGALRPAVMPGFSLPIADLWAELDR
jgi:Uma2 family endonuclease